MQRRTPFIGAALLALALPAAAAGPNAVTTFHSIGLYWSPPEGSESNAARVQFRKPGDAAWRQGLDLWFDPRNGEYRGSLVELEPGSTYEIRLRLESGAHASLNSKTWSEKFPIKRTLQVAAGKRLVIGAEDSGDKDGYVLFTAPPGRNVIEGNDKDESCVVVRQGTHHVIIRGLVLRGCKRYGIMLERSEPAIEAQTHDIVIEDNEISDWGNGPPNNDGAIHCRYYRETDDARRPDRIVIQGNTIRDPRHSANPWRSGSGAAKHPAGPQGVAFERCGRNHVIRYNDIYSKNGKYFNDGVGGGDNFSSAGFPWADADIYGNRISHAYDDGIEAEGGNRNVRIWGNYLDYVHVAIANAATAVGPLYVWRNVSNRMAGMNNPDIHPDREQRGPFIKAGSRVPAANGGRAYYFHNTALQPPPANGAHYPLGAGGGISKAGGPLHNVVSRNNVWQVHNEKFFSIRADAAAADFDVYNGRLVGLDRKAERRGVRGRPSYEQGTFALKPGSPGYQSAERLPNFNDRYPRPDAGAHQSGTAPMLFGVVLRKN